MHTHTHMTVELTMSSRKLLHDLIKVVVCVTVFMAYDTTIHAHTHTHNWARLVTSSYCVHHSRC